MIALTDVTVEDLEGGTFWKARILIHLSFAFAKFKVARPIRESL